MCTYTHPNFYRNDDPLAWKQVDQRVKCTHDHEPVLDLCATAIDSGCQCLKPRIVRDFQPTRCRDPNHASQGECPRQQALANFVQTLPHWEKEWADVKLLESPDSW